MELPHDRHGAGEPLILVHGLGDSSRTWNPVVPALAARREVWTIDLPGFGRAADLRPESWSVEGMADAVAGFAEAHGLGAFDVAGNSLGGGIALLLAARGTVRSAVAISPIGFAEGWERGYGRANVRATRAAARLIAPVTGAVAATAPGRALAAGSMTAHAWRLDADDLAARLGFLAAAPGFGPMTEATFAWRAPERLAAPTTVAWGERDLLLLPRQAQRARRRHPAARHVWLRGGGHIPMADDPQAVVDVLLAAPDAPAPAAR